MANNVYTDAAPWLREAFLSQPEFRDIDRMSRYLTMRDGVKIAVDLYLPKGVLDDTKLPAIIHQTRYYRRFNYRWIFKPYLARRESFLEETRRYVKHGYAVVNVDVRGTGASYGSRQIEWCPDEVKDGAEVVDWIVQQPWSDGSVGTLGTSYTGSAAEFLLTNQHEAVKAAVIRYANFDTYPDALRPGGILNENFLRIWSRLNHSLDNGKLSEYLREVMGWIGGIVIRNVAAVDEDKRGKMLAEAQREHVDNYDIFSTARNVRFSDDTTTNGDMLDQLSPANYLDHINGSRTPIYSWSGWFDGGFTLSTIKRYLCVDVPGKRLILGPWDHGGGQFPDPNAKDHVSKFDHSGEVLRFFDFHLKGSANGVDQDPPVRYYTMGEGVWKSSQTWPPPGFEKQRLFFADNGSLVWDEPPPINGSDMYKVDLSATSGVPSRWLSLVNVRNLKIGYKNRSREDKKLLVYQTDPLEEEIELTGHPILTLFFTSTAEDGAFFIYLEDITPRGDVHYVTEGMLRVAHRKVSLEPHPYHLQVPFHTYKKEDFRLLIPGEVAKLSVDLLPVSYLFRKGHAIRVAIAGADKDNFEILPDTPPDLKVLWGGEFASGLEVPVQIPSA
jgi:putative CocE/NonD family hydrolase